MTLEKYRTPLEKNVTKEYKKLNDKIVDKVNKDDKKVASKLELATENIFTQ